MTKAFLCAQFIKADLSGACWFYKEIRRLISSLSINQTIQLDHRRFDHDLNIILFPQLSIPLQFKSLSNSVVHLFNDSAFLCTVGQRTSHNSLEETFLFSISNRLLFILKLCFLCLYNSTRGDVLSIHSINPSLNLNSLWPPPAQHFFFCQLLYVRSLPIAPLGSGIASSQHYQAPEHYKTRTKL